MKLFYWLQTLSPTGLDFVMVNYYPHTRARFIGIKMADWGEFFHMEHYIRNFVSVLFCFCLF